MSRHALSRRIAALRLPPDYSRWWVRWPAAGLIVLFTAMIVPRFWCGRDATRWLANDGDLVLAHARAVAASVEAGGQVEDLSAQRDFFHNEWLLGTYQMAALGLLQVCLELPERRAEFLPVAERAIDELLSERVRAFDTVRWREDPLASLDGPRGHAAYLGYLNLVLSLHRRVVPDSRFSDLNDRISAALARRLQASRHGILETYPLEGYPVDNAAVLGSLLLHARNTGSDYSAVAPAALARFSIAWLDPRSGLLFQSINPRDGKPAAAARASGTARAAFLLSYGERAVSGVLFAAVRDRCADSFWGFGYLNEHHIGSAAPGIGDINSVPLVLGVSPSASGFALGGARVFDDRRLFVSLYRTAHLAGTPVASGDRRVFVTGGPLGNAIMLAMLTARSEAP
jgi:hypothetical protein